MRQLSRGGGRKNDQIDAAAAACAAALQGDGRPLQPEDLTDALALLDESRTNLAQSRVRLVNQLHALLRDLLAGGAPTDLSATTAAALLRQVRPSGDAERVRKQIATGLVSQIRSVDSLLKANAKQINELIAASGSTLTGTIGIGAITAGRLIGRTGRAARFPTAAAFANYAGAAPVEVASADKARHRLSRSGDRQLNAALHTVAIRAARQFLTDEGVPGNRLLYYGESLGAAVVAELATEHPPAGLVLRSPFTNLASVGQIHYPFLPVRALLKDRFPVAEYLARVAVPIIVVYGTADSIVPPGESRRSVAVARGSTRLVAVEGADHNELESSGWSRVLRIDAVGGSPHCDFANEGGGMNSSCSPG